MEIAVDKKEKAYGLINLKLEESDYLPEFNKKIKEYSQKANIKGFRPGKVPAGMIKKMYGKGLKVEIINQQVYQKLNEYIKEEELPILFSPLLKGEALSEEEITSGNSFDFEFEVFLEPEIELPIDESFKVKSYSVEVSDEDLKETLDNLKNSYPEVSQVEEIAEGDFVKATFKAVEGEFEKETVLPLKQVEEEVRKTFIGKKKEEDVKFDLKKAFPEANTVKLLFGIDEKEAEELSGEFSMTILEITRNADPEMNEEFFKKILGEEEAKDITTEAEFEDALKEKLAEVNKPAAESLTSKLIRDGLTEKVSVDMPEEFLKKTFKMTNEEGLTDEQVEEKFPEFKEAVKWRVIGNKVFKDADLKVEPEEIKAQAAINIKQQFMGYNIPLEEGQMDEFVNNYLSYENGRNYDQVFEQVFQEKVLDQIKSKISFEEETVTIKKLNELLQEK
ncbi:trigger factor [Flexithrix dorotheae]|uniref:trigger factor n=1 Tax=Flexithrix dorotheae TaxID=70993 RepID=UPI00036B35FB|nr:trigger factor [Flexithrix dorotheae]